MQKDNNAIVVTSIIAGVILVIALVAMLTYGQNTTKDTVTVAGTSTLKVIPDRVSVHFTIQTNGSTSAEASNENNDIYDKLYTALILDGFDNSEIGTESYSVYPNTIYIDEGVKTDGFIAVRSIEVEFAANESGKLTIVVDNGINAGAGVSYINFELSSALQNKYKADALAEASKDAKAKADAVAEGFGKRVGSLVSVSVNDYGYYPWNMYAAESAGVVADSAAKLAAANIRPTTQDVTASVSATYKLL